MKYGLSALPQARIRHAIYIVFATVATNEKCPEAPDLAGDGVRAQPVGTEPNRTAQSPTETGRAGRHRAQPKRPSAFPW